MCKIYQFWVADTDIDDYRIDAVKHMDPGATRIFASSIHEFTQSLGKVNFYLIGEITRAQKWFRYFSSNWPKCCPGH